MMEKNPTYCSRCRVVLPYSAQEFPRYDDRTVVPSPLLVELDNGRYDTIPWYHETNLHGLS